MKNGRKKVEGNEEKKGEAKTQRVYKQITSFFFKKIYFIYVSIQSLSSNTPEDTSNPITDSFELTCGCWELNSGSLEEQSVLLTAEPSFQPP